MAAIVVYQGSLYPVPDTYFPKHLHTFNELSYLMVPDWFINYGRPAPGAKVNQRLMSHELWTTPDPQMTEAP